VFFQRPCFRVRLILQTHHDKNTLAVWWWRELHRFALPSLFRKSSARRLLIQSAGPLIAKQFTGLFCDTRALSSSTLPIFRQKIKMPSVGWHLIFLVKVARVELASESISTRLSPSAADVFLFRLC
jgi:hypothetical protein